MPNDGDLASAAYKQAKPPAGDRSPTPPKGIAVRRRPRNQGRQSHPLRRSASQRHCPILGRPAQGRSDGGPTASSAHDAYPRAGTLSRLRAGNSVTTVRDRRSPASHARSLRRKAARSYLLLLSANFIGLRRYVGVVSVQRS
jgi:hypothetical protein